MEEPPGVEGVDFFPALEHHWTRSFGLDRGDKESVDAAWECLRRTLGPGVGSPRDLLRGYSLVSISDLQSQQCVPCCSHLTWSSEEFNKWVRQNEDILPNQRILQQTHLILFGYLTNERHGEKDRQVDGNLYIQDNTGILPCEFLHFKPDWVGHLLLFPSWIFIPQRDQSTAGYVEILGDPVPVIPSTEKTINIVPVFYPGPAAQLLSDRSQCKKLVKLNVAGELFRLSSILHISRKTFFFLFLKCFSSAAFVPILVQKAPHLAWHHALKLGQKYVLTDLKMSCLKASEMKIFITSSSSSLLPYCMEKVEEQFLNCATEGSVVVSVSSMTSVQPNRMLEVKEEEKMLVPCKKSKMVPYTGTVTRVLNAQAGLFELDNKFTLCLAYQQLLNSGRGLRPGACIELRDVHLVQKDVDTSPLILGACLRSTVTLKSFSAYSTLHQPIIYFGNFYVQLVLRYNLSLPFYLWLVSLIEMFKQRFCCLLPHHQVLGTAEKFTVPVLESLVLPRKHERNVHLEILGEPHRCPVEQHQILEPPCQIPPFSLLYPMVEKQCWEGFSSFPQLSSVSEIHSTSTPERNHRLAWPYCSLSAESFQPHMVLLGVLECSRRGYLTLRDRHKTLPCVIFHRDGRPFAETSVIGCLLQVEIFQFIMEQFLQSNFPSWQQLETPKYIKDRKSRVYVQFFFEDAKILYTPERRVPKNLTLCDKRNSESPTVSEGTSSGAKGNGTSTAEHKSSDILGTGRAKPAANMPEHSEDSNEKYSWMSRLFLVTQKEGFVQRNYLPSSELKRKNGRAPQLCFQATVLWMSKPELYRSLGENENISTLEKTNEDQQKVLLLFLGKSLRWFAFLHPDHIYRLIIPGCSDLDVFDKPLAPGSHLNSLNCSLFLRVPENALLYCVSQFSQPVSPMMEQKLFSIEEIHSPRFTGSLVSFSGEVVERNLCESLAGRKSGTDTQQKANLLPLDCTAKLSIAPAAASPVQLDVYIEAHFLQYLWGVLPGARILFWDLQRKISRFGNVYCTYIASSCMCILTPPLNNLSSQHVDSTSVLSGVYLYNVALQPPTVCQIEGRCSQNHPPCLSRTGMSKASAKILVDDGTSEFVVLCKNQQVQKVLSLSTKEWNVIQHHVQSKGTVYIQPNNVSSGPARTEEPEDRFTWYLRSLCRSPVVCRTIRLTCQLDRKSSKVQETGQRQLRRFYLNELEFLSHIRSERNMTCLNIQEAI